MTTRKKILIPILLLSALTTVLRETGIVTINYYSSSSNTNPYYQLNDSTIKLTSDTSTVHPWINNRNYTDVPVMVIYENDTLYSDELNSKVFIINIDQLSPGFLWLPLYKSSNFSASATVSYEDEFTKINDDQLIIFRPYVSGQMTVNGDVLIKGICSHNEAVTIIKDLVVKVFVQKAKQYLGSMGFKYQPTI